MATKTTCKPYSVSAQYGAGIKALSVYMSQFQLIPYNRIQDYFADQLQIPINEGSIFNFNQEAYQLLADFEDRAKAELAASEIVHADETAINIGGKRGRVTKSKSRHLLDRLRDFEENTLRFMDVVNVPFTNNLGENDIRR